MMQINGQHDSDESSETEIDAMAENYNTSQIEKIEHLEKKILEQGDEIICLRSTLANVVRRLEQVEANYKAPPGNWGRYGNSIRNGGTKSPGEYAGLRLTNYSSHSNAKESVKRSLSTSNSGFLQRRQAHYQSTGSLHSAQSNNSEANSSNSASPIPISPSPSTQSNSPGVYQKQITATGGFLSSTFGEVNRNNTQSPSVKSGSNLHNSKRWSSTGDFAIHSQIPSPSQANNFSRSSAKSLLNLFPRHHSNSSFAQVNNQRKHGNNEIIYNEDEGLFRMYLRGRPVVVHIPSAMIDTYDVNEIAKPPSERLKLDWVYGYRGRDCRSNLHFLPTGEMVYFVAAVVVLYNVEEQSQRHYLGHTDDVKCLAIHPNKMLIATGQCAGHDRLNSKPHVRVWNSVSLHTVAIIGINEFEKSICCLTFSKVDGGALLCAIDESADHTITVWDWQKKERSKVTENKCSVDTVIAAEFHPLDRHCIVTCGKAHIAFWILDQNGTLYKRMGIFENRDKPKFVTCLAFTQDGDTLSGDSNGNIIVWGRGTNTISKLIRGVHETAVFSICVLKDGTIITGGGKDRKLVMLNSEFYPVEEGCIAENYGGIRQISESKGSQLLIGTTKNCILIGSFAVGFSPAVVGHTEEIWGCTMHPNLPQFLTAGFDGIINVWDSLSHTILWTKDMMKQIQTVQFSPDGSVIIVGFTNGKWCVLDGFRREILSMYQDGNEVIQDCKFSPDGSMLALGSRDSTIYIYQASENFTSYLKVGRCVGHSSFVTHMDWSKDSQYLRSNSGDYELLYWQASTCRQVTQSSSLRDVEWATNDCTITFETVGIWQDGMDGTDINNCARSNNKKLLVTGDDFGKLKLYNYPVIYPKSLYHSAGGHSSHVTNVGFINDDSRIVSVGGKDTSVMQWKIS